MLDLMRKHARNWLMKLLLGMVIVVFVFYFGSLRGKDATEAIATIDGKPITYGILQREYQNLLDFYQKRLGDRLSDQLLKSLNLKQQALDNLIYQSLILKKAEEMRVTVTDDEIRAYILASPLFQRDGAFDERIYQQMLRYNKTTPEEFEVAQRKVLTSARIEELIQGTVKVSDQEIQDLYRLQSEKINLSFVQLSPQDFQGRVAPNRQDLEGYLKEHSADFRVPEQIQVKILAFWGQDFAKDVKIPEQEIGDYFDRHRDRFAKPGGKVALADVKDRITAELKKTQGMAEAARAAKKAYDTIYQDEKLEAYASQHKVPLLTTGFFTTREVPPELRQIGNIAQTVFALQKDDMSRVLSDEKGYYLIKVVAKKPAYTPALQDIEREVAKRFTEAEARKLCQKEADSLLEGLRKKGEGLGGIAREKNLKVMETGLFSPGEVIPKIGPSPELTEALYQLSEKRPLPEKPVWVDGRAFLVEFKGRSQADQGDFQARKETLRNGLLQMKRAEAVQSWMEATRAAFLKAGRLKILKEAKDL